MIVQLFRLALEWEDDFENMPDYGFLLEYLGLPPDSDRETVRDAVTEGLALLGLQDDLDAIGMELDAPQYEPNDMAGFGADNDNGATDAE